MKFHSLKLENFQTHELLEFDFSKQITCITGPSNIGKSSIIRALYWVCLNQGPTADYVRHGAKEMKVMLRLSEGSTVVEISRKRFGSENVYTLGKQEFKAFSRDVPEPIRRILQLTEINFQGQDDPHFWISDTAGDVSRNLNTVIDLTVIDHAIASISSEVRTTKERKDVCAERLETARIELEKLELQRERPAEFYRLKKQKEAYEQLAEDQNRLAGIIQEIRDNNAKDLSEQAYDLENLLGLARSFFKASRRVSTLSEIIEQSRDLEEVSEPPSFVLVQNLYNNWRDFVDGKNELSELMKRISESELAVEAREAAFKASETKFHASIRGRVCPLCGKDL